MKCPLYFVYPIHTTHRLPATMVRMKALKFNQQQTYLCVVSVEMINFPHSPFKSDERNPTRANNNHISHVCCCCCCWFFVLTIFGMVSISNISHHDFPLSTGRGCRRRRCCCRQHHLCRRHCFLSRAIRFELSLRSFRFLFYFGCMFS